MRNSKLVCKLSGVILAIAGAVIIIHTVPVFLWYVVLIALVLAVVLLMLVGK